MRGVVFGAALLAAGGAVAHDDAPHEPQAAAIGANTPGFPAAAVGGPFRLVDQRGAVRTEADPQGRPQLVFFGYAACPGICSAALPALADLTDRLKAAGRQVTPVLVTVDPAVDTVERLSQAAPVIHPDLVALTGSPEALEAARDAFQVEAELLFVSPEHGPIYAHGSYIYLLDGQGTFLTLLPPILSPERMAEVALSYF